MKRPRYSDIYDEAYHSKKLSSYVDKAMRRFCASPLRLAFVPHYLEVMLRTQTIGGRCNPDQTNSHLRWALRLSHVVTRYAARRIARCWLEFYYRPGGPWLRQKLVELDRQMSPINENL